MEHCFVCHNVLCTVSGPTCTVTPLPKQIIFVGNRKGSQFEVFLQISVGYKILVVIEMNNTVSAT